MAISAALLSIDNGAMWESVAGMPSDNLKSWACSYHGYSEDVGRSICRLEVPRDRVTVILGFGDRLQISPMDSKKSPVNYQAFVVGLGGVPLQGYFIREEALVWYEFKANIRAKDC